MKFNVPSDGDAAWGRWHWTPPGSLVHQKLIVSGVSKPHHQLCRRHNGSLEGTAVVMYLYKLHSISLQAPSPSCDRDNATMADARAPNLLVVHRESFEPCKQVAELRLPQ